MLIQCPICRELFTECSTVVGLQCGHLFHELCLTKWLGNKCDCPQCRAKCKKTSYFKIYFSRGSSSNYSIVEHEEEASKLSEELCTAKISIKEKSLENSLLATEKNRLQEIIKDLTEKLKKSEDCLKQEEYQRKLIQNELKISMVSLGQYSKENTDLKKKVETLGNVQVVVNGCEEEIDSLISNSVDIKQIATWCTVYRKELDRKKVDLRLALDTTRRLRKESEVHKVKEEELMAQVKILEDEDLNNKEIITSLEDKIKSLTKKLVALQAAVDSPRNTARSLVHRLLHESPAPMNLSNLNDSISTPVVPRLDNIPEIDLTSEGEPVGGEKENNVSRKRKSSNEWTKQNDVLTPASLDEPPPDKPQKKLKKSHETSTVRNPLLDLGIFKKHRSLNGFKSSSFLKSSTSSSNASDVMVVRKGYNGLGGQEKYVGPGLMKNNSTSVQPLKPLLPRPGFRKNLGPSTNISSLQSSKRNLFSSSMPKIDDLF